MAPLEVRFAHPVRLPPATHSQGHGRPCLQRSHPRRGFSAIGSFSYGNMLVPGLIKFRGVSGYPLWAEESPLRQLPAGPAGDNRAFPHHRLSSLPLFHYARLTSLPLGLFRLSFPMSVSDIFFRRPFPMNSPDGLSTVRVSVCLISEQVGRMVFG